jgi:hypothetical protein
MKTEESRFIAAIAAFFMVAFILFAVFRNQLPADPLTPKPTPTPLPVASQNIVIDLPHPNQTVSQTFAISGKARVFENVVSIRIRNKTTGKIYLTDNTMTQAPDVGVFGAFSYTVQLKPEASLKPRDTLIVDVFQVSAKDGSDADLVSIPVHFSPLIDEP